MELSYASEMKEKLYCKRRIRNAFKPYEEKCEKHVSMNV